MLLKNKKTLIVQFTILFLFIPIFLGAMNINQVVFLKKDGTGSLTISYFAKESEVKEKNFLIGNFPFQKEKLDEYFGTKNTKIYSSSIEKNAKDNSSLQVTVTITFGSITHLSQMKAFSGVNISLNQTDTGKVFRNVITPDFITTNSLENVYINFKYDEDIKSTNANAREGKNINWFSPKEFTAKKNNLTFWVNLGGGTSKNENVKSNEDKEKSCGLFGIELPLIVLLGSALMFNQRRRSKK